MHEIPLRRLGRTNLLVSELGLGTYQLTSEFGVPRHEAHAILDHALVAGINFFDTAPVYGWGESEELIGRALTHNQAGIAISTKVGRLDGTIVRHAGDAGYRDESLLRRVIEHSLHLIRRDRVEIMMIHEPDWPQWGIDRKTGAAPIIRLLETLKRDGLIGAIGMGGRDCDFMADIVNTGRIDVVLTYMHYDLAVQDARDVLLPAARKHDVGVILGGPFRQGALAAKQPGRIAEMHTTGNFQRGFNANVLRRIEAIYALSDETGMNLSEMGIRFLLSDPQISTVIPGPRSVRELQQNLAAASRGPLEPGLVQRIESLRER